MQVRYENEVAIRATLKRRRHEPVADVGRWLQRVVQGYFNYHAVPGNLRRRHGFRLEVIRAPGATMEGGHPGEAGTGCRGKPFGSFL